MYHATPRRECPRRIIGFTLIELLVVIGIIALLIGIILPVLALSRDVAKKVHCSAQLKQINLSLEIYGNDFREQYPVAGHKMDWGQIDTSADGTGMVSWMEQIFDYMPSKEVLSGCHSYPRETPYHYFMGARAAYLEYGGFGPLRRLRLKYPTAYVLTGDNTWDFNEIPDPDADKDDYTQRTLVFEAGTVSGTNKSWEPHHVNGLNVGFADGHVASFAQVDPDRMTWRYNEMSPW